MSMRFWLRPWLCAVVWFPMSLAAEPAAIAIDALARLAIEPSGTFRIDALERGTDQPTWLELRATRVYATDARLILNDGTRETELPPPAVRHYVGHERGQAGRLAFVSIHPDGSVRGWLRNGREIEWFGLEAGESGPASIRSVDMSAPEIAGRRFECGSDELPLLLGSGLDDHVQSIAAALDSPRGTGPTHFARIAVDTDVEYYQRFNNPINAAVYVADLIGVISATYVAEVRTALQLSYVRLWTGGSDPWSEPAIGCCLRQFGKHWNDNMSHESRALTHLLSGRSGGGIAWVGTLCRQNLQASLPSSGCDTMTGSGNYGGHYGVSAGIRGNLNPGNPQVVWDLLVVAHELGHNFNSPHTHCYGNIGGNPNPVDGCNNQESGNNCHSGATSLPGPQGAGSGTIMSYCHTLSGGVSNIANSFGLGHPYGNEPDRVPARMRARVLTADVNQPGCLLGDLIFANGFQAN